MEKIKKISIALFLAVLMIPTVSWGIITALDCCGLNIMETLNYDVGEKREKNELAGQMTRTSIFVELENYYNDRVPFRSEIITANKKLTGLVEKPYNNFLEKKYVKTEETSKVASAGIKDAGEKAEEQEQPVVSFWDLNLLGENNETADEENTNSAEETGEETISPTSEEMLASTEEETPAEISEETDDEVTDTEQSDVVEEEITEDESTSELPLRVIGDRVIPGADGWLFWGDLRNIDTFARNNLKDESELAGFATSFISLKADCDYAGKELRCIVVPEKETIYPEYYPKVERNGDICLTQQICQYMAVNSSVTFIYPKDELMRCKGKYQLYYKHDSHWNAAGGYIGTAPLLSSLGVAVPSLDSIYTAPVTIESGDLVLLSGLTNEEYAYDTNYDVGYMNHVGVFSSESFLSDVSRIDITSQSENHKMLVLIGDSCKMNMLPFIAPNFDRVVFIHKNAVSNESVKDVIKQADVIVLESSERAVGELSSLAWKVHAVLAE